VTERQTRDSTMPIRKCPKPFNFPNIGKGIVHREELVEKLEEEPKDYYKVAQLLEWKNGESAWSIRFGYYLKRHGTKDNEWQWGSQTTSIISIENLRKLIEALANLMETYEGMQKERETKKPMP
jgi:hypothetical protein